MVVRFASSHELNMRNFVGSGLSGHCNRKVRLMKVKHFGVTGHETCHECGLPATQSIRFHDLPIKSEPITLCDLCSDALALKLLRGEYDASDD